MANEDHLRILEHGVKAWNEWREENPTIRPDLALADLSEAKLIVAHFTTAVLSEADLRGANLGGANLLGADLTEVLIGQTTFADLDLSVVKGIETMKHSGPSFIGIDTIYRSLGNIPEVFLRRCRRSRAVHRQYEVSRGGNVAH
jgi:hypothetical protein